MRNWFRILGLFLGLNGLVGAQTEMKSLSEISKVQNERGLSLSLSWVDSDGKEWYWNMPGDPQGANYLIPISMYFDLKIKNICFCFLAFSSYRDMDYTTSPTFKYRETIIELSRPLATSRQIVLNSFGFLSGMADGRVSVGFSDKDNRPLWRVYEGNEKGYFAFRVQDSQTCEGFSWLTMNLESKQLQLSEDALNGEKYARWKIRSYPRIINK